MRTGKVKKVWGALLFALAVIVALCGVFTMKNAGEEGLVVSAADKVPATVDTNIATIYDLGEVSIPDPNVYKETTVWDIKTRILAKADVYFVNPVDGKPDNSEYTMLANEFHISLEVNSTTYTDIDDLSAKPFASLDDAQFSTPYDVTVYVRSEKDIDGHTVELDRRIKKTSDTVQVTFSDHPKYDATKGIQISVPEDVVLYSNTVFRNFTKYEFFYRASIKGVLEKDKSAGTYTEMPRELLEAKFVNGIASLVPDGSSNDIQVSYENGGNAVVGTLASGDFTVKLPSTRFVTLELNTGEDGTIRRASETSSDYYRVGLPEKFARPGETYEDQQSKDILTKFCVKEQKLKLEEGADTNTVALAERYHAFVGDMDEKLLGYGLRVLVYDNNGGITPVRGDDDRVTFVEGKGVATSVGSGGKDSKVQIGYAESTGAAVQFTSNELTIHFQQRYNAYLDAYYKQSASANFTSTTNIDNNGLYAGAEEFMIARVESDGRYYTLETDIQNRNYNVIQNTGLMQLTRYQEYTRAHYDGTQYVPLVKADTKEEYTDDTYVRNVQIQLSGSNTGTSNPSAYIPLTVKYENITEIKLDGSLSSSSSRLSVGAAANPGGLRLSYVHGGTASPSSVTLPTTDGNSGTSYNTTLPWRRISNLSSAGASYHQMFGKFAVFYYTAEELQEIQGGADGNAKEFFKGVTNKDGTWTSTAETSAVAVTGSVGKTTQIEYVKDLPEHGTAIKGNTKLVRIVWWVDKSEVQGGKQTADVMAYRDFIVGNQISVILPSAASVYMNERTANFGALEEGLYAYDYDAATGGSALTGDGAAFRLYGWNGEGAVTSTDYFNAQSRGYRYKLTYEREVLQGGSLQFVDVSTLSDKDFEIGLYKKNIKSSTWNYFIVVTGDDTVGNWRVRLTLLDSVEDKKSEDYALPALGSYNFHRESDQEGYYEFSVNGRAGEISMEISDIQFGSKLEYKITYTAGGDVTYYTWEDESLKGAKGEVVHPSSGDQLAEYQVEYEVNGYWVTEAPVEPGLYRVRVTVWEHGNYSDTSTNPQQYSILKQTLKIAWKGVDPDPSHGDSYNPIVYRGQTGHQPYVYFSVENDGGPYAYTNHWDVSVIGGSGYEKLEPSFTYVNAGVYTIYLLLLDQTTFVADGGDTLVPRNYYQWPLNSELPHNIHRENDYTLRVDFEILKYEGTKFRANAPEGRRYADENTADNVVKYTLDEDAQFYGDTTLLQKTYLSKETYDTHYALYEADVERLQGLDQNVAEQYPRGFYSYLQRTAAATQIAEATLSMQPAGEYYAMVYLMDSADSSQTYYNPNYQNYAYYESIVPFTIGKRLIALPYIDNAADGFTYLGRSVSANVMNFNSIAGTMQFVPNYFTHATTEPGDSDRLNSNSDTKTVYATNAGRYVVAIRLTDYANNEWDKSGFSADDMRKFETHREGDLSAVDYEDFMITWFINRAETTLPQGATLEYIIDTAQNARYMRGAQTYEFTATAPSGFVLDRGATETPDHDSVYSATDAGKYEVWLQADKNHFYTADPSQKDAYKVPSHEQDWVSVTWEIAAKKLDDITVTADTTEGGDMGKSSLTYKGSRRTFVVNNYQANSTMQYTLTGETQNAAGDTITFDAATEAYDQHYSIAISGSDSKLRAYATYYGEYTVTVTLVAKYEKNFYWLSGSEHKTSCTATFNIEKATAQIDWHAPAGNKFTYDPKKGQGYEPTLENSFGDTVKISPVYYTYAESTVGDALGDTEGVPNLPKEAGDYLAVISRAEIESSDVKSRRSTSLETQLKCTYSTTGGAFTVFDNYDFDGAEEIGATGKTGIKCELHIVSSLIDLPELQSLVGDNSDLARKSGLGTGAYDVVVVPFKKKGDKYTFTDYLKNWADWEDVLVAGQQDHEENVAFDEVLWDADKTALDYYVFVVRIKNPENYSWDNSQGGSYDSEHQFIFYLQITPTEIDLPEIDMGAGSEANTYETPYTDAKQAFKDGVSNYEDYGTEGSRTVSVFALGGVGGAEKLTEAEDVVRGLDNVVSAYEVHVALADANNTVWKGGLEYEDRTFQFKITPVDLKVEWTDTALEYDTHERKPSAAIANEFGSSPKRTEDEVVIAFTLSSEDPEDSATINGDAAVNAGVYTATVQSISGKDAGNYNVVASNKTEFIINKKGLEKPEGKDASDFVYTQSAQTYTFQNSDSDLMEIVKDGGKEPSAKDLVNGSPLEADITTGENAQKELTVTATHAGKYSLTIRLKDTKNYYWKGIDDDTYKVPTDETASADAEYADFWEIKQREIKAPTLVDQRGKAYLQGSAFYPKLVGDGISTGAESSGDNYTIGVKDGSWKITFSLKYFSTSQPEAGVLPEGNDITSKLETDSVLAGYYYIELSLIQENSDLYTDYVWTDSGNSKESEQVETFSLTRLDKVIQDGERVVIRLAYRITRGTYSLTFEVDDWTYGDHVKQQVNKDGADAVTGNHVLLFTRTSALPPTLTDEATRRSVVYHKIASPTRGSDGRVNGGEQEEAAVTALVENNTFGSGTNVPEGYAADAKYFVPEKSPYLAGAYAAVITYDENGLVQGEYTLEKLNFTVYFEIKPLTVDVKWSEDELMYNGEGQMTQVFVVNNVITDVSGSGSHTDTVNVSAKWTDERPGEAKSNNFPVDVRRSKYGDTYEAYKVSLDALSGADAGNYKIEEKDDFTSEFKISPKEISLKADNLSKVYGDALTEETDLKSQGLSGQKYHINYSEGSENFLSRDNINWLYFALYAVKSAQGALSTEYVVTTTEVGNYHTRIVVLGEEELKNYVITFVDGEYEVTQKEVTVVWGAKNDFTFNGKDQYASYNAEHLSAPFVYYNGIDAPGAVDGGVRTLTPKIEKAGVVSTFKDAGEYSFTVDSDAAHGLTKNYKFAAGADLNETYNMQKRAVSIRANTFSTQYGVDPTEEDLKWLYADGTSNDNKFVDAEGQIVAQWAKDADIYDGDGVTLTFKTATNAITDYNKGALTQAGGSADTYLVNGRGAACQNNDSYNNYKITVTGGRHSITKRAVDIKWEGSAEGNEDIVFTYNGENQLPDASKGNQTFAYFTDAEGQKVYLLVRAVLFDGDAQYQDYFRDVRENEQDYYFYVTNITNAYNANYTLDGATGNRYHAVQMKARTITIAAQAVGNHEYGEDFVQDELVWDYKAPASAENKFTDTSYDSDYGERFTLTTDLTKESNVQTKENAFTLQFDGETAEFTNADGTGKFFFREEGNYNYKVYFENASVRIEPRKIRATIGAIDVTYGSEFTDVLEHITLSYNGENGRANALANSDRKEDVLQAVTLVDGRDLLNETTYPSVNTAGYSARLTALSENYDITYTFGRANGSVSRSGVEVSGVYKIRPAQIFKDTSEGMKATAYSSEYDASSHAAATSFTLNYFKNTVLDKNGVKGQYTNTFSAAAEDNGLKLLFRYKTDAGLYAADWSDGWTDAVVSGTDVTTAGYEWKEEMPSFTHAGTYKVYYAVVAENHEPLYGEAQCLTVEIAKHAVSVSANFYLYYSETIPARFQPEFVFGEDDFLGGESYETADGYNPEKLILVTVPDYTAGVSGKGSYDITFDFSEVSLTDYTLQKDAAKDSKAEVRLLPLTITVNNQNNSYYLNAAAKPGTEKKADLTKIGEAYTISVNVTSDLGSPVTDIRAEDYTAEKTGQKIFRLETDALPSGQPDGNATGAVGSHAIKLFLNAGYDDKYSVESYQNTATYTIKNADIKVEAMHGFGQVEGGFEYDEEEHYALHLGADHTRFEEETSSPEKFASSADKGALTWEFILLDNTSAIDPSYNSDKETFWSTNAGKVVRDTIPSLKEAGSYALYYRITRDNHNTAYGAYLPKILQADNEWDTPYSLTQRVDGTRAWTYGAYDRTGNAGGYDSAVNTETLPVPKYDELKGVKQYPSVRLEREVRSSVWETYDSVTYTNTYFNEGKGWFERMADGDYKNGARLPAGNYRIAYSMAETTNYKAIAEQYVTFTVAKKTLTVRTTDFSIVYGESVPAEKQVFSVSGFVNGEKQADVLGSAKPTFAFGKQDTAWTPYVAGNYRTGAVGEYTIRLAAGVSGTQGTLAYALANGAGLNYKFTEEDSSASTILNGTMTVVARQITVNINSLTNRYQFNKSELDADGQPNAQETPAWNGTTFTLSCTNASGEAILPGDKEDNNDKKNRVFKLTTTALTFGGDGTTVTGTNNVGKYEIICEQLENDYAKNYKVTASGIWNDRPDTKGTYEITPARLTASPTLPTDLVYNGQGKAATAPVVSGFHFEIWYEKRISGDSYEEKTQELPVDAGTYRVSLVVADSDNYVASVESRNFTITPKQINVTAELQSYKADETTLKKHEGDIIYYLKQYVLAPLYAVQGESDPNSNTDGKVLFKDKEAFSVITKYNGRADAEAIDAGAYTVEFSTENGNYSIHVINGDALSFTIQKMRVARPTATLNGRNKTYNGVVQAFAVTGFNETVDSHTGHAVMEVRFEKDGEPVGERPAEFKSPEYIWNLLDAGKYSVIVSLYSTTNYEWSTSGSAEQTLTYTVNKKVLHVKAQDTSIKYGDKFEELSVQLLFKGNDGEDEYGVNGGFVLGETASEVITGYASETATLFKATAYSTEYSPDSDAGSRFNLLVQEGVLSAKNYELILNTDPGFLTVEKRELTLKVASGVESANEHATSVYSGERPTVAEPSDVLSVAGGSLNTNKRVPDTLADLEIAITVDGTATAAGDYTDVGNHRLTAVNNDSNYEITFEGDWESSDAYNGKAGVYVITPKTLNVTAGVLVDGAYQKDGTIVYGEEAGSYFAVEYTADDWAARDNTEAGKEKLLLKAFTFTATKSEGGAYAAGDSHAGETFTVTISNAEEGGFFKNYVVSAHTGTMKVVSRRIRARVQDKVFETKNGTEYGSYVDVPAEPTYTNTVKDHAPETETLTYTGTLKDGSGLGLGSVPQRVGDYKVKITLKQNSFGEYDYLFDETPDLEELGSGVNKGTVSESGKVCEADFHITPQKIELRWELSLVDLADFTDNKGENDLVGFINDIMDLSFMFAGVPSEETEWNGSKMTVKFEQVGQGIGTVTLKEQYQYDYVLVAGSAESTTVVLTFSVQTSSMDFTVSITGWTYNTYNAETNKPIPDSEQIKEELATATIIYSYSSALSAEQYRDWTGKIAELSNKGTAKERRLEILAELETIQFGNILPVNAGYYMLRAQLEAMPEKGYTAATAVALFEIEKAVIEAPVMSVNDGHDGGHTFDGNEHSVLISDGYDGLHMILEYAGVSDIVDADTVKLTETNAGTYTVYFTLRDKDNETWETGHGEQFDETGRLYLTWTIAPGQSQITGFDTKTVTYGETYSFEATADFDAEITYQYVLMQGSEESGSRSPVAPTHAGTYKVIATSAADSSEHHNWSGTTKETTLVINKAKLTVRAEDKSVVYGESAPANSYSVDGWQYSDGDDLLGGAAAAYTVQNLEGHDYAVGDDAGSTYTISVKLSGYSLADYEIPEENYETGTLTVAQRRIRIVVSGDISTVYSKKAFTLDDDASTKEKANGTYWTATKGGQYYDVVLGDILTVQYTINGGVNAVAAGTYTVEGSLAETGDYANYLVSFASGTLTIEVNTITISEVTVKGKGEDGKIVYNHGEEVPLDVSYKATYTIGSEHKEITVTNGVAADFDFLDSFRFTYTGRAEGADADYAENTHKPYNAGMYRLTVGLTERGVSDPSITAVEDSALFRIEKYSLDSRKIQAQINGVTYKFTGTEVGPTAEVVSGYSDEAFADLTGHNTNLYRVDEVSRGITVGTYDVVVRLVDYNNYQWIVANQESFSVTNSESVTLHYTVLAATDLTLRFDGYSDDATWDYDGAVALDRFHITPSLTIGDVQSSYVYYVATGDVAPQWTTREEAESNGWTRLTATSIAAVGNAASTAGTHWLFVRLPGTENYNEAQCAHAAKYVVSPRKVNIVVNGGDDYVAATYEPGMRAEDISDPTFTTELQGAPLGGAVTKEALMWNVETVFSYSGLSFGGKEFGKGGVGENEVEAGKYEISVSFGGEGGGNFAVGTVTKKQCVVARKALYGDLILTQSIEYNGQPHAASEAVQGSENYGTLWTVSASKDYTDVNEYTFQATILESAQHNYYWARNAEDATKETAQIQLSRDLTFTIVPASKITVTLDKYNYTNGDAQYNVNKGESTSWAYTDVITAISANITVKAGTGDVLAGVTGTIQYRGVKNLPEKGFNNWTTTLPTDVREGGYYVRVVVAQTTNYPAGYSDGNTGDVASYITILIQKKQLAEPTLPESSYTYTGEEQRTKLVNFDARIMAFTHTGVEKWNFVYNDDGSGDLIATEALTYTVPITFRDPDSYEWADGADGILTWTINKAESTFSYTDPGTKTYGEDFTFTGEAKFGTVEFYFIKKGSYTAETITSVPLSSFTKTTGNENLRAADTYWVRVIVADETGGDPNFTYMPKHFEFTIERATLTVTVNDYTITYGDAAPASSELAHYTVEGYFYEDSDYSAYTFSTNYTQGNKAATYEIDVATDNRARLSNYNVTVVKGSLKVERKHITVNILSQSTGIYYVDGGLAPSFDTSEDAWELAEGSELYGKDKITVNLSLEAAPDGKYIVGSYLINGEANKDETTDNYDITFIPGALTVSQQAIDVNEIIAANTTYGAVVEAKFKMTAEDEERTSGYLVKEGLKIVVTYHEDNGEAQERAPRDAGAYTVELMLEDADPDSSVKNNYTLTGKINATFLIEKAQLDPSVVQEAADATGKFTFVYSQNARQNEGVSRSVQGEDLRALEETAKSLAGFLVADDMNKEKPFTAVSASGTDVGSYDVTLTLQASFFENYRWTTTEDERATILFYITKPASNNVVLSVTPGTEAPGWEFDGLTAAADAHKGQFSFQTDFGRPNAEYRFYQNGELLEEYPHYAGTYEFQIHVPETENYPEGTSNKQEFTIAKRKLVLDATAGGGEYEGVITPASATVGYYRTPSAEAQNSMYLGLVVIETLYWGESNDKTWNYSSSAPYDAYPTKAGDNYHVRFKLSGKPTDTYNNNFVLVDAGTGEPLAEGYKELPFQISKAYVFGDRVVVNTVEYDGRDHYARETVQGDWNSAYGKKYIVEDEHNTKGRIVGRYRFYLTLVDTNNYRWAASDTALREMFYDIVSSQSAHERVEITEFYGIPLPNPEVEFPFSQANEPSAEIVIHEPDAEIHLVYGLDFHLLYAPEGTRNPAEYMEYTEAGATPAGWSRTMLTPIGNYVAIAWVHASDKGYTFFTSQISYEIVRFEVKVFMETTQNGIYKEQVPEFSIEGYDVKDIDTSSGEPFPGTYPIRFFPALTVTDAATAAPHAPHAVRYVGIDNDYDSSEMPVLAGKYKRIFTLSSNYESNFGAIECEFEIVPKTLRVSSLVATESTVWYDGTPHFVDKEFLEGQSYTLFGDRNVFSVVSGLPVTEGVVNVRGGGYPIDLLLNDTRNYVWDAPSLNNRNLATVYFFVERSGVSLNAPEIGNWTYGADASVPAVSGVFASGSAFVGDVIWEYSASGTDVWTTAVPVNAGEYLVRARLVENENHEAFVSKSVAFTIYRAKLTRPTAGAPVKDEDGEYTFLPNDYFSSSEGLLGNTATTDGTYRATVSILDKNNYEWEDGSQDDIVIEWEAARNMTTFYIIIASLGGAAALGVIAFVPLAVVARRKRKNMKGNA